MWQPEALVFIDSVPKGATGKPARIGLARRLGVQELGVDQQAGKGEVNLTIQAKGNGDYDPPAFDSLTVTSKGDANSAQQPAGHAWLQHAKLYAIFQVLYFHTQTLQSVHPHWLVTAFPIFMLAAGAVSTPVMSSSLVKRNAVGLLLPCLLLKVYLDIVGA